MILYILVLLEFILKLCFLGWAETDSFWVRHFLFFCFKWFLVIFEILVFYRVYKVFIFRICRNHQNGTITKAFDFWGRPCENFMSCWGHLRGENCIKILSSKLHVRLNLKFRFYKIVMNNYILIYFIIQHTDFIPGNFLFSKLKLMV